MNQLIKEAYDTHLLLAHDICRREVSDYLLEFVRDNKMLALYKRASRRGLYIYLSCITSYIETYWEMWENEKRM